MPTFNYEEYWKSLDWQPDPADQWFPLVRPYVKGTRILDLGCAGGRFIPLFRGYEYFGVDISPLSISDAKEKYPTHQFYLEDIALIDTSSLKDDCFDTIFTWVTLQHITPERFAKVAKWMKKHSKRIIMGESLDDGKSWSGHCFKHDYKRHFDIFHQEQVEGTVYLQVANGEL